mgnify:CR=1 FL=1
MRTHSVQAVVLLWPATELRSRCVGRRVIVAARVARRVAARVAARVGLRFTRRGAVAVGGALHSADAGAAAASAPRADEREQRKVGGGEAEGLEEA